MRTVQRSFAAKYKSGVYSNFYGSLIQMRLCGSGPFFEVDIIADEDGDYYTWHSTEKDRFHFTNSHEIGVEICFTYGSAVETKRGRGKIIRCRIEWIRDVPSDERDTKL